MEILSQPMYGIQYIVVACCCAVMLISFLRINRGAGDNSPVMVSFSRSILFAILGAFMDIPYAMREYMSFRFPTSVCYLTEILYSVSGILSAYYWFRYSEWRQKSWVFQDRFYRGILSIPAVTIVVLCCLTPLTHLNFYFENGQYIRGPLSVPTIMVTETLVVSSGMPALLRSFRKENYLNKNSFRLLFVYAVGNLVGQILQLVLGLLMPFRTMGATAVFMIVTIRGIRQEVTVDALTHINNRFAMDRYLGQKFENGGSFWLMMLDMDEFKQINDRFGHVEGDRAIRIAASTIACSMPHNAFVCRYGGDEFCVIAACSEREMEEMGLRIQENVRNASEEEKLPVILSLSFGFARKDESISTIPDLIEAADKNLYKNKLQRKHSKKA